MMTLDIFDASNIDANRMRGGSSCAILIILKGDKNETAKYTTILAKNFNFLSDDCSDNSTRRGRFSSPDNIRVHNRIK